MNYNRQSALKLIKEHNDLIGKNIFKTNNDIKITDVIMAPSNSDLFSRFMKEYTISIGVKYEFPNLDSEDDFRVLVLSFNQFDNMLYYQDIDKYMELVIEK